MVKTNQLIDQLHPHIRDVLSGSQDPLLLAHVRPDGDAVGSVVALGLALQHQGKTPKLVFSDGLPRRYHFLTGSGMISTDIQGNFDLVISMDCANFDRISAPKSEINKVDLNIDHHVTNESYADINFILPDFASTTSILAKYLPVWGFEITKQIADALLMGMVTDTIGFRTSNVTPEYLRIAAGLLDSGADLPDIYHKALTLHSETASRIWGYALSRLETQANLAWTSILIEDRKRAEYQGMDDADLTNHLSSIENIDISILFNEQKDDKVKVSWRSTKHYDVTKIAARYGGGGHPQAAGAEVTGQLAEVREKIIGDTKQLLEGN